MSLADKRRNLGPNDFEPVQIPQDSTNPQLVDELRPVFMSQSVAKNASGSCYVEVGNTRIECCVFGPQPLRGQFQTRADISVTVKVQEFANIAASDSLERLTEDFVRSALLRAVVLEEYPKSSISLLISIISGPETFSTTIAAATNAATMALVNAGIAMHDMVTATAVSLVQDKIYADAEVENSERQLIAAYMAAKDLLVSFEIVALGGLTSCELARMIDRGQETARELRKVMNGYLVEDYSSNCRS